MQIDEQLAYWTGAVQTDGSFGKYFDKSKGYLYYYIHMNVGIKSLPMLNRFHQISKDKFNSNTTIFWSKKYNQISTKIGVKKLVKVRLFEELDLHFDAPPRPSRYFDIDSIFGAYLAGVIDGDGDIRTKRPKYPQCAIRITSGKAQNKLREAIKNVLNCSVGIYKSGRNMIFKGRKINSSYYVLEFCVSKKNIDFVKKHILPWISIKHKHDKLAEFIQKYYNKNNK